MRHLWETIEWYLGVPALQPGQPTVWRPAFSVPWPFDSFVLCGFLLCLVAVFFVVWAYLRDTSRLPSRLRVSLISLRCVLIVFLALMACRPVLVVETNDRPQVALLLDQSASMGLTDDYSGTRLQSCVRELLGDVGDREATRWSLAQAVLTGRDARFLTRLLTDYRVRVYQFSETARAVWNSPFDGEHAVHELVEILGSLEPRGEVTRPGPALQQVLDESRSTPPAAIVILTDGRASTGVEDRLSRVPGLADEKTVPLFIIGVGTDVPDTDIALESGTAPAVALMGDPIPISVHLRVDGGVRGATTARLKLLPDGNVVSSQPIRWDAAAPLEKVEFTFDPPAAGEFQLAVEVEPLSEETNVANNRWNFHVSVHETRIHVLMIDSRPRWEFRSLKALLEREKTVELHTVLLESDPGFVSQDETARPLQSVFSSQRNSLSQYDAIIFGDVDPSGLSRDACSHLRKCVAEQGSGLIVIAGERYTPSSYRGTELASLLPVELPDSSTSGASQPLTEGLQPKFTSTGLTEMRIQWPINAPTENQSIWTTLPELYWRFPTGRLKPGAVVLAETSVPSRAGSAAPLVVMQRYGAGIVVFHASDELWRWNVHANGRCYNRYWLQTIRSLGQSRLLSQTMKAVLSSNRQVYLADEAVRLQLRFFNSRDLPADRDNVVVTIERDSNVWRNFRLEPSSEEPFLFDGRLTGLPDGVYRVRLNSPAFQEDVPAVEFQVRSTRREIERRSADHADLQLAANLTGGKFYTIDNADRLVDDLPGGEPVPGDAIAVVPLWNRWEVLFLFLAMISTEWFLRRQHRLV